MTAAFVAAVGDALVEAGIIGSVTTSGLAIATAVANIALSIGLSYALGAIFAPSVPGIESQDAQRMVKNAIASRKVIYGEARVSGAIVFHKVTRDTIKNARPKKIKYLHLVVVLAGHECESIGDIQLNNVSIADTKYADPVIYDANKPLDLVRVTKHLGQSGQVVDPDLMATFPAVWTEAHTGDNLCYLYMKLASIDGPDKNYGGWTDGRTFWGGIPNVTAEVRGKKVHDVRNGAYPNDTPVWSANWALCMADYLTDAEYGAATNHPVPLDVPAAIAAANLSDERVHVFKVWDSATAYLTGDFVGWPNNITTGLSWKAVINNQNVAPPTIIYWLPTNEQAFRRAVESWDATKTYTFFGQQVEFGGVVYSLLASGINNTGIQPGTDPNVWVFQTGISDKDILVPLWLSSGTYIKNGLATRNGIVYRAYMGNSGHDPALDDVSTWYPVERLTMWQNRYECNGVIDTNQTMSDVVSKMRTAAAGTVLPINGMYKIAAGAFDQPTIEITEDDLRGPIVVKPRTSRKDLFDAVKGVFIDPRRSWQTSDFPLVHNPMYQAQDYGFNYVGVYNAGTTYAKDDAVDTITSRIDAVVWVNLTGSTGVSPVEGATWHLIKPIVRDIQLPFTTDVIAAQRIAKIFLERERQGIVSKLPMKMMAYQFNAGDSVKMTNVQLGWANKEFRISELSVSDGVDLTLHEDAANSYLWDFGDFTLFDPNLDVSVPAADVTNLVLQETMQLLGGDTSHVSITWTPPSDPTYVSANAYFRELGATEWIFGLNAVNEIEFDVMLTGKTYQVQVNSVSKNGLESMSGPIGQITLDGGTFAAIQTPINPTLGLALDKDGNVSHAQVSFDFAPELGGPVPDGFAIMWQVVPNRNALTLGADSGSSVPISGAEVLGFATGADVVNTGSDISNLVATNVIGAVAGFVGQWWLRVTDNASNTSQWRKAKSVEGNIVHMSEPFDITPVVGWSIDVVMLAWVDDRTNPNAKLFYSDGEVFSWGAMTESGGVFSLTGLQRGLEGTPQTTLTGKIADYYPAPGGNTKMLLVPRSDVTVVGTTVSWSGVIPDLRIPAGSFGSATIGLYKTTQNGNLLRSNIVLFTVVSI